MVVECTRPPMNSVLALLLLFGPANLPRKAQTHRIATGGKVSLTLQQLEKRVQIVIKGPGVLVCAAERKDERGARIDLEIPGVIQETLNIIPVAAGVAAVDVPKGSHTVDVSAWSLAGAKGSVTLSLHMQGYRPPPVVVAQPSSLVARPKQEGVVAIGKLPVAPAADDGTAFWKLTPAMTASFRVAGPRTIAFEARRLDGPSTQATRVIFTRDGQTTMSALLHGQDGELETIDVEVPEGSHVITLRAADAGILLRLR